MKSEITGISTLLSTQAGSYCGLDVDKMMVGRLRTMLAMMFQALHKPVSKVGTSDMILTLLLSYPYG